MAAITPSLLRAAVGCTAATANTWAAPFEEACAQYDIDTPLRMAYFLGPAIGHESLGLYYVREVWGPTDAQIRYERDFAQPWPASRAEAKLPRFKRNALAWSLGNTQKGDGRRFAGRGFGQTTGRANHAALRDRLRVRFPDAPDFEAQPEQLERAPWAVLSATDYWQMRDLAAAADADNLIAFTKKWNGGTNGLEDRRARLTRAKRALEIA